MSLCGRALWLAAVSKLLHIADDDYEASFDNGKWTMRWNPYLSCRRLNYAVQIRGLHGSVFDLKRAYLQIHVAKDL